MNVMTLCINKFYSPISARSYIRTLKLTFTEFIRSQLAFIKNLNIRDYSRIIKRPRVSILTFASSTKAQFDKFS